MPAEDEPWPGPPSAPAHTFFFLPAATPEPVCAVEGDIVTMHWQCINEAGEVLESTRTTDEPTTFEVGAGDVVGNRLFEAFDEAVRGMAVGDNATLRVRTCSEKWERERQSVA